MGKRGPQPGTVKKPPGSGRKPGQLNRSTADVKLLVQQTVDMTAIVKGLAQIAQEGDSDAARVAASRELLDRAYGKATQYMAGEGGGPIPMLIATGVPRASEGH